MTLEFWSKFFTIHCGSHSAIQSSEVMLQWVVSSTSKEWKCSLKCLVLSVFNTKNIWFSEEIIFSTIANSGSAGSVSWENFWGITEFSRYSHPFTFTQVAIFKNSQGFKMVLSTGKSIISLNSSFSMVQLLFFLYWRYLRLSSNHNEPSANGLPRIKWCFWNWNSLEPTF